MAMVHNERRAFSCAQCAYTSRVQGNVKRHKGTVHVTDRPHSCSLCKLKYRGKTVSALAAHVGRIHGKAE